VKLEILGNARAANVRPSLWRPNTTLANRAKHHSHAVRTERHQYNRRAQVLDLTITDHSDGDNDQRFGRGSTGNEISFDPGNRCPALIERALPSYG
jgi:hypothetical protein